MTTYGHIRRADFRTEHDRETWAGASVVVLAYDAVGVGAFQTELLDFGLVFEDVPFFSYGVELLPGETLTTGDYPLVTCGVIEWETTEADEDSQAPVFYLGAFLWISIASQTSYRIRFRLSFEGTAMRNVEYFRGLNG